MWICVKGYGFLSFAKNKSKDISNNISKSLSSKYSQKFLDHDKPSATETIKIIPTKKSFRKQQNQLVIWLEIKLLIKLQTPQELHLRLA